MTDRYIDQDEIGIYGPHSSKKIRERVAGLLPTFDPALLYIADQIDTATTAVQTAVSSARDTDAQTRQGSKQKSPLIADASELLGRFSRHLDSHKSGTIDRKVFFTTDGTIAGIGRGANDILLAITHIATKLSDQNSPVRERPQWHQEFSDMAGLLGPAIAFADDARADRRVLIPEIRAAREAWLNLYEAAKSIVACVLRLSGKLHLMNVIFYDLAVPGDAKVSAPPSPDTPDESKAGQP